MTKYYTFRQNNSFGKLQLSASVTLFMIFEANSAQAANDFAERNGIYFNGCSNGDDCPCCGDRWSRQYDDGEGEPEPMIYGEPLTKNYRESDGMVQPDVLVFRQDGTVQHWTKRGDNDDLLLLHGSSR